MGGIINKIDKLICGNTQLPIQNLAEVGVEKEELKKLFRLRFRAFVSELLNSGKVILNQGLAHENNIVAASGYGADYAFYLNSMMGRNLAASQLNKIFINIFENAMKDHKNIFQSELIGEYNHSSDDVKLFLQLLNTEANLRQSELQVLFLNKIQKVLIPVSMGVSMMSYGETELAIANICIGLSSFVFDKVFYKIAENKKKQLDATRTAKKWEVYNNIRTKLDKIFNTTNAVSHIDKIINAFIIMFANKNHTTANITGTISSLSMISSIYSTESLRVLLTKQIQIIKDFLEIYSSDRFLFTEKQWQKHIENPKELENPNIDNGIVFENLKPKKISHNQTLKVEPLNIDLRNGEVSVIKASSGSGKSFLIQSIMKKINSTGEIHFVKDGKAINVKKFPHEEIAKKIIHLHPKVIDESYKIVDIMKEIFLSTEKYKEFIAENNINSFSKKEYDEWEVIINTDDNQLAEEKDKSNFISSEKLKSIASKFRDTRSNWINQTLKTQKGNLRELDGNRMWTTLSDGEKLRILALYGYLKAKTNENLDLLILDEPLSQLDEKENLLYQLQTLKLIQRLEKPPAIIIISHQYIKETKNILGANITNLEELNIEGILDDLDNIGKIEDIKFTNTVQDLENLFKYNILKENEMLNRIITSSHQNNNISNDLNLNSLNKFIDKTPNIEKYYSLICNIKRFHIRMGHNHIIEKDRDYNEKLDNLLYKLSLKMLKNENIMKSIKNGKFIEKICKDSIIFDNNRTDNEVIHSREYNLVHLLYLLQWNNIESRKVYLGSNEDNGNKIYKDEYFQKNTFSKKDLEYLLGFDIVKGIKHSFLIEKLIEILPSEELTEDLCFELINTKFNSYGNGIQINDFALIDSIIKNHFSEFKEFSKNILLRLIESDEIEYMWLKIKLILNPKNPFKCEDKGEDKNKICFDNLTIEHLKKLFRKKTEFIFTELISNLLVLNEFEYTEKKSDFKRPMFPDVYEKIPNIHDEFTIKKDFFIEIAKAGVDNFIEDFDIKPGEKQTLFPKKEYNYNLKTELFNTLMEQMPKDLESKTIFFDQLIEYTNSKILDIQEIQIKEALEKFVLWLEKEYSNASTENDYPIGS